jgi:hypothetical protein
VIWPFLSCASNSTYLLPHSTPPHTPPPSHYPCILSTMPHLSFTGLVLIFFQMFSMIWICAYFCHRYGPFELCLKHVACILSFESLTSSQCIWCWYYKDLHHYTTMGNYCCIIIWQVTGAITLWPCKNVQCKNKFQKIKYKHHVFDKVQRGHTYDKNMHIFISY